MYRLLILFVLLLPNVCYSSEGHYWDSEAVANIVTSSIEQVTYTSKITGEVFSGTAEVIISFYDNYVSESTTLLDSDNYVSWETSSSSAYIGGLRATTETIEYANSYVIWYQEGWVDNNNYYRETDQGMQTTDKSPLKNYVNNMNLTDPVVSTAGGIFALSLGALAIGFTIMKLTDMANKF